MQIDRGTYREELDYISSRGLMDLILYGNICRRWNRGDLRLYNITARIKEAFDLSGLTPEFRIFEDAASAVGSF